MTTVSLSTLQVIYLACLAVLFVLLLVVMIFFLRLVVKWTKVAELLNKKLEGGWRFFDFTKLAALKGIVMGALPYLSAWFANFTEKTKKKSSSAMVTKGKTKK